MLLGFKRRFEPMILSHAKTHTIRGKRKRPPRVGETCHCYVDPRQKTMRLLGRWPCVRVENITIEVMDGGRIWIDGVELEASEREALAIRDGFKSFEEMFRFWRMTHGLGVFRGDIIHWRPVHPEGLDEPKVERKML